MDIIQSFIDETSKLVVDKNDIALVCQDVFDSLNPSSLAAIKLLRHRDPVFAVSIDKVILLISSMLVAAKLYESDDHVALIASILNSKNILKMLSIDFDNEYLRLIALKLIEMEIEILQSSDEKISIDGGKSLKEIIARLNLMSNNLM